MTKKAKVTIFILVGILLIIIASIALSTQQNANNEVSGTKNVKVFVEECLAQTAEKALKHVAEHGGYYELPEFSTSSLEVNVPIYILKGEVVVPEISGVENSIEVYVEQKIDSCLKDFKDFKDKKIMITSQPKAEVLLNDKSAIINLVLPLEIVEGNGYARLSKFSESVPTQLKQLYNHAVKVVEVQKERENDVHFNRIGFLDAENNFSTSIIFIPEGTYFSVTDSDMFFRFVQEVKNE